MEAKSEEKGVQALRILRGYPNERAVESRRDGREGDALEPGVDALDERRRDGVRSRFQELSEAGEIGLGWVRGEATREERSEFGFEDWRLPEWGFGKPAEDGVWSFAYMGLKSPPELRWDVGIAGKLFFEKDLREEWESLISGETLKRGGELGNEFRLRGSSEAVDDFVERGGERELAVC